ncbi:MAG: hypothetical protein HY670_07035 [Chloroflexi bacterium]|nr:hypothetical protein [Chloroflexota bacterium]
MSEKVKESGRKGGAPIWGVILLVLGIILLLQTFNVLPWGLWGTLWRFWPVILIIIGLNILLRHANAWLISLITLVILGITLGVAVWRYNAVAPGGALTEVYLEPLDSMTRAQVTVDFKAGGLSVDSLPSGATNFIEAKSSQRSLRATSRREGTEGRVTLGSEPGPRFWGSEGIRWDIDLARNIPLTLNVKVAAGNANLDFTNLKVTDLALRVDAGNGKVTLPAQGTVLVDASVNAGNLDIVVPEGMAARIKAKANVGSFDIRESRFPRKGDYYVSPGFDTATNRVDLDIDVNVGKAEVR